MKALFGAPLNLVLDLLLVLIVLLWLRYLRLILPYWIAQGPFIRGDYDQALRRLSRLEGLHLTTATLLHLKGTILMFS